MKNHVKTKWFSTHPRTQERVERLLEIAQCERLMRRLYAPRFVRDW
jgi:Zn-dependent protease with chaperone function